jgi:hypothetical protein
MMNVIINIDILVQLHSVLVIVYEGEIEKLRHSPPQDPVVGHPVVRVQVLIPYI